ncbi:serine--tRNA ligase [Aestuariivirga sp.]|uniref:serine--tRNA ligase n=1 Tax=Aestuariivirga sp. TaxID=2650926 RepID=UPI0025BC87C9|nr:serine--tRNA ligase [Aestuariivirga sp.]MCA3556369.1 serine--tRNA ligase [Aestuariivirga sp.]
MHDIKAIRDNPAAFDLGLARRGLGPMAAGLLSIDAERRDHVQKLQDAQARRNAASKEIGEAVKSGDKARAEALKAEMGAIKDFIATAEAVERDIDRRLTAALAVIPNIPLDDVPDGKDETGNVEVRRWGAPGTFNYEPRQHFDIGEWLGLMDFEAAAKISGARFVVMKGPLARLERALAQFMLDHQTGANGYTEHFVPFMVNDAAMYGTGQLPKFAEDLFRTTDGRWLIPTAEVSLTNLVRESVLDEKDLPLRLTAYTPCFRAEAGAAGRDTRGMIRQHQFSKVELVSITTPEQSRGELERMTAAAESVLQALRLPYRVLRLCAGDMGFGSRMTYDLEVWLPGQKAYREISSCSVCGDFQARRMDARFRPADGKGTRHVHTLNGSGLAVGRTMVAILENYQNADGSVTIPEALRPYMGGADRITRG